MSDQLLDSLQIDNTGDGGSFNETYQSEVIGDISMPDNANTVSVAEGFDVRRGFRKEVSAQILDPDSFSGTGNSDSLVTDVMEARHDVVLTFNWKNGSSTVLSGAKMTVLPIMDVVPDNVTVYYDTDVSATDNPDTDADSSWTVLTEVVGSNQDGSEILTRENGRGLPYYIAGVLTHDIPLFYDGTAYSNIKTEEDNRNEVRIAIENQAGNFRIYGAGGGDGVHVEIHQMPAPEPSEVNHMMLRVYQSGSLDDIITFPTGADDYFYGTEITAEAWGHDEGDILTENR